MPTAGNHPGVYIAEQMGGFRTVPGVATSIAAFVGWAARGPVDHAQRITSFHDFTQCFGGLDGRSLLGYAVRHFFANGGEDAWVVRLAAEDAATARITLDGKLLIEARSPGQWGNDCGIGIRACSDDPGRFCMTVWYAPADQAPVLVESFGSLSMLPTDERSVMSVLEHESAFVSAMLVGTPTTPPADTRGNTPSFLEGGLDGDVLQPNTAAFEGRLHPLNGTGGMFLLDRVDLFNLLCVPGETTAAVVAKLQKYCRDRRAFCIVDSVEDVSPATMQSGPDPMISGVDALNSALYYPWVEAPDPLQENRMRAFPPCGFVAGIYARTDFRRGVWKAPAGNEANLTGASAVVRPLTDDECGALAPRGINCIRTLPRYGTVLWGSRTLHGADENESPWKYVPVRRLALFIEESLVRGTRWAVFEPNDAALWTRIRVAASAFMDGLFRQGAFQGRSSNEAYFVKCDSETTATRDIKQGMLNIVVGFAPLKPAEFVVFRASHHGLPQP